MPHGVCPSLPDGVISGGVDDGNEVWRSIWGEDDADTGIKATVRKLPIWACTWKGKKVLVHGAYEAAGPHG